MKKINRLKSLLISLVVSFSIINMIFNELSFAQRYSNVDDLNNLDLSSEEPLANEDTQQEMIENKDSENNNNENNDDNSNNDNNQEDITSQEEIIHTNYNVIINFLDNSDKKQLVTSMQFQEQEGNVVDYSSNISSVENNLLDRGYTPVSSAILKGIIGKDLIPTSNSDIIINLYYEKSNLEDKFSEINETADDDKHKKQYYKITFNYIDGLTSKKLAESRVEYQPLISTANIQYDERYIDGYDFNYCVKISHSNGDVDMNMYYSKVHQDGEYSVVFNYIDEETNEIILVESMLSKLENGDEYDASSQDKLYIQGYKYIRTVGNVKGTIKNSDEVINVYYKKIEEYTVTINYIDYNTHEKVYKSYVSSSINQGQKYNLNKYNALNISGYKYYKTTGDPLSGTMDSNKVINVYYLKKGESIVSTGDYGNLYVWMGLLTISVFIILGIIIFKIKSTHK